MKIALVSIRYDQKGGSERRTCHLARGLVRLGHAIEIFAASVEDLDVDAEVRIVPMYPGPSFIKVASFTKNVGRMLAVRSDIDVVHNQIRPFTDGIVTVGGGCHAQYLELSGKRFTFFNPTHKVVLDLERERYRPGGCRAVITNSEFAKKGILKHYPIPQEKVFVVYNGVDSKRFDPDTVRVGREELRSHHGLKDEPVLLFIGSGFERKGLSTLIRALPLIHVRPGWMNKASLLVVGKDDPGPYKRLAEKLGVSGSVVFTGPTRTPERFYGAADVFVLPTFYDPFSNAAMEAMACGLPVITTANNGVSELIVDGESGMIMDNPDDHEALAEMVGRLGDKDIRTDMGRLARSKSLDYTWDKTLESTLAVYRLTA
jgi:UDP-glucose:(heptosyl)LPS alpha-1,3-glucosyltransferase